MSDSNQSDEKYSSDASVKFDLDTETMLGLGGILAATGLYAYKSAGDDGLTFSPGLIITILTIVILVWLSYQILVNYDGVASYVADNNTAVVLGVFLVDAFVAYMLSKHGWLIHKVGNARDINSGN
jgi:hypothetical protein